MVALKKKDEESDESEEEDEKQEEEDAEKKAKKKTGKQVTRWRDYCYSASFISEGTSPPIIFFEIESL